MLSKNIMMTIRDDIMSKAKCERCGSEMDLSDLHTCKVCNGKICSRCWNKTFELCFECESKVSYKVNSYVNGILNGMGLNDGQHLRNIMENKMLVRYMRSHARANE